MPHAVDKYHGTGLEDASWTINLLSFETAGNIKD